MTKESDERGTPASLIRRFHDALGGRFGLDPASGAEPIRIADERFTKNENGLARDWNAESVWLNPPYSDPTPWMKKLQRELSRDDPRAPSFIIALVRGDCSADWFQHYGTGEYLCLVGERLSFTNTGDSPRSSNFIIGFGDLPESVLDLFDQLGSVYRRSTVSQAAQQGRLDDLLEDGGVATAPTAGTGPCHGLSVSLDRLQPCEQVTLEFDTSRIGAVHDLPDRVTVEMLPDGRSFDTETGEISVNMLGPNVLEDGGDLYVQIRESAYAATRVEVAVAVEGRYWELAPVERIESGVTPTAPAGVA
jgi:hypothetical protein